jgi:hypothetical protein
MNKETGGPAFPIDWGDYSKGMTLRDYFAAKALQAFISRVGTSTTVNSTLAVRTPLLVSPTHSRWNMPYEPGQAEIRAIEAKLKEKNT